MKNDKKMKLSKFKIAKINNLELKGGIETNACLTSEACLPTYDSCSPTACTDCVPTIKSRTTGSL